MSNKKVHKVCIEVQVTDLNKIISSNTYCGVSGTFKELSLTYYVSYGNLTRFPYYFCALQSKHMCIVVDKSEGNVIHRDLYYSISIYTASVYIFIYV